MLRQELMLYLRHEADVKAGSFEALQPPWRDHGPARRLAGSAQADWQPQSPLCVFLTGPCVARIKLEATPCCRPTAGGH